MFKKDLGACFKNHFCNLYKTNLFFSSKKKDTSLASFSLNSYQFSFCFVRLRVLTAAHKKSHAQKNQQQNPASFSHTESPFRTTSRFQVAIFPPAALQYALSPCLFTITASKICAAVNNDDVSMCEMKQFIPGMLLFLRSLSSLYRRQCRDKPSSGLSH